MRALAAAAILAWTPPAAIASDYFQPDYASAEAAGYRPLEWSTYGVDDDTSRFLDKRVVAPWMRQHAPGEDYRITYSRIDFSGDGRSDYVVQVHTSADLVPEGSPFLAVYMIDGPTLGFVDHGYDVAAKRLASGEKQLAFIDFEGFHLAGE